MLLLLLLGLISGNTPNRSWLPDAANLQYEQYWKLKGGFEAVSNRADMLSDNLLALGAQYGWQLAGMMLMGAALMVMVVIVATREGMARKKFAESGVIALLFGGGAAGVGAADGAVYRRDPPP